MTGNTQQGLHEASPVRKMYLSIFNYNHSLLLSKLAKEDMLVFHMATINRTICTNPFFSSYKALASKHIIGTLSML